MHPLLLSEKEWSLDFCSEVAIQLLDKLKHLAMETVKLVAIETLQVMEWN